MGKRVLLVTTDYPPLAGTNTRRVAAFAKYLPRFGWNPLVVTMATEDMPQVERGWPGTAERPQERRLRSFAPQAIMRRLRGVGPRVVGEPVEPSLDPASQPPRRFRKPFHRRLAGWVWTGMRAAERALLHVPDPHRMWALAAARNVIKEVRRGDVEVVVTSAPPFSAHVAGLAIKRRTGVPWVADFRDLWVGRPYRELAYSWHDTLDRRYERLVAQHADLIIVASPRWRRTLIDRYGERVGARVECVLNGYDADLAAPSECPPAPDDPVAPLRLAYTGALCVGARPWPLLDALKRVSAEVGGLQGKLELTLIGDAADETGALEAVTRSTPLAGVVRFLGPLPYSDCLAAQSQANALVLLSEPLHKDTVRGSSFEYMATGCPILALLPHDSVQEEVLRPSELATVVLYDDVPAIADIIKGWIEQGLPPVAPNWPYIRGLTREAQTRCLADMLEGVTARGGRHVGDDTEAVTPAPRRTWPRDGGRI